MRNYQLLPRTMEESKIIIPRLENIANENLNGLNVVKEPSGNILQIRMPEKNIALVFPMSNIIYYMTRADENMADYKIALELSKTFEKEFPESGGWIVRYHQNDEE